MDQLDHFGHATIIWDDSIVRWLNSMPLLFAESDCLLYRFDTSYIHVNLDLTNTPCKFNQAAKFEIKCWAKCCQLKGIILPIKWNYLGRINVKPLVQIRVKNTTLLHSKCLCVKIATRIFVQAVTKIESNCILKKSSLKLSVVHWLFETLSLSQMQLFENILIWNFMQDTVSCSIV